jgi:pimeloyl-ACP methyl ester carboxylesterase
MTLDQQLETFRTSHPRRTLRHQEVEWRYTRSGAGPAIVVATGALGIAEAGFQVQSLLERRFTVISPDYPDLESGSQLLDGYLAILDAEGVRTAVWHGGSFGGLVVQRVVERAPDRVAGIVLSHTGVVSAGRMPGWALGLLAALPSSWVQALFRRRLRSLLAGAPEFWYRWFDQAIASFTKDRLLRRLRLADSLAAMPSGPRWTGPTLIIESDNDPAVRPEARAALRAAFPGARVHRFSGTGHSASVLDPDATARVVAEFAASVFQPT